MSHPLVSVVMVVRNVERFLAESIESILNQTLKDFEFIIVDFGSTDHSKEIQSNYAAHDTRINLHEIPACSLVEARNAACALATGQYIAVMDADDVSLPNRLELEVEFLRTHPDLGAVGGAAEWINADGVAMWVLSFPTGEREIKQALLSRSPFCHASILVRRKAFEQVGRYRVAFTLAHDYDLLLRISETFGCANLDQVVVRYRIHPHQVSLTGKKTQTLCKLAAQVSASLRKTHRADALDAATSVSPELLSSLGLSEAEQEAAIFSDLQSWINATAGSGDRSTTLELTSQALKANWKFVSRADLAELEFAAGSLHWRLSKLTGLRLLCRAAAGKPALVKRIGKAAGRKLLRLFKRARHPGPSRTELRNSITNPGVTAGR